MNIITKKTLVAIVLLLFVKHGFSQESVPVFKSKSDSSTYYSTLELMRNHNPLSTKRVRMDSLWEIQQSIMKNGILGWQYVYKADKTFVPVKTLINKEIDPTSVKKLSIENFAGKKIPAEVFACKNLEELELVNTNIRKIPKKLNGLSKLYALEIYNNQSPKKLRLSKNSHITFLKIRNNKPGRTPSNFRKFPALDSLDLCRNFLKSFPNIDKNTALRKLVLSENNLTLENFKVKTNESLQTLYIRKNKIQVVPDEIGNFKALKKLSFNYNEIIEIKNGIANLQGLEELSLYQNKLSKIPKSLYQLKSLKEIDLYYNQIERIEDEIANLKKLEILYLSNNRVHTLSDNIGELANLRELYLHHNRVSHFPATLSKLSKLKVLRFNDNSFAAFPDPILSLQNLENLDMSRNQLQTIPSEFGTYKKLQLLIMSENPWEDKDTMSAFATKMRSNGTTVQLNVPTTEIDEVSPNRD
jgi:Leucine-rich repeat (LRR) protein